MPEPKLIRRTVTTEEEFESDEFEDEFEDGNQSPTDLEGADRVTDPKDAR